MIEKLTTPEVQAFIHLHEHDDPALLMLQSKKYPHWPFKEIVQQVQSRQKANKKLPKWHGKEGVIFPPPLSMEQCSSEITAKFKAKLLSGQTMADLTGGAGVDAYYFSQSFQQSHYVEQSPLLCEIARHNFGIFSSPITVHNQTAETFLSAIEPPVDFIYIDPARRNQASNKVFLLQDCAPDILSLQLELLKKAKQVMIKTSPMLDIQQAESTLRHLKEVYVIAVENEVKEVLYLLQKDFEGAVKIKAVNLDKSKSKEEVFSFIKQQELALAVDFAMPGLYIYEPNKAILKAGAFKSIGHHFNLAKLHPHSHLYTSDILVDFPGRVFECLAVIPYQKKAISSYLPERKANITTRNFPDTVPAIRKKLKIQEGGDIYLLATTNMDGKLTILLCKKCYQSKPLKISKT